MPETHHSALSPDFDPFILLDSIINLPLNDKLDVFYSTLFRDIKDKKLLKTLIEIKESKLALGNPSHVIYLLPWSVQPANEHLKNRSTLLSNANSETRSKNLKNSLQHLVTRTKYEAKLSEYLLGLRLTGYAHMRNVCYNYLRWVYNSKKRVTVVCKGNNHNSVSVRYRGHLDLFDKKLNVLLTNVQTDRNDRISFVFIRLVLSKADDTCAARVGLYRYLPKPLPSYL